MPPGMGMASGGRPQWQNSNTSTPMNYSSSSPGNYGVSWKTINFSSLSVNVYNNQILKKIMYSPLGNFQKKIIKIFFPRK